VRVAVQALAATLGEPSHFTRTDTTRHLHFRRLKRDAGVENPTDHRYESGVANAVDPLAGSYYVEHLTDEIEKRATELIARSDELGGQRPRLAKDFFRRRLLAAHTSISFASRAERQSLLA
jgi:methylmalonyl-CoA mutase N-terminal domain/subunit